MPSNPTNQLLMTNSRRTNRRDFLSRAGCGFGSIALAHLLSENAAQASPVQVAHTPPKAKNIIFLFMEGGPSHLDTFDRKPLLNKIHGTRLPKSFGPVLTTMGESDSPLLGTERKWKRYGESGLVVSDWLPQIATHADDLCVIRSCWTDGLNHVGSVCEMNTGSIRAGRPSLGCWVSYGLGSENQSLPSFVVLLDNKKLPHGGTRNWGTGFMPATYQGVQFQTTGEPIPNLRPPADVSDSRQKLRRQLLRNLNQYHLAARTQTDELEARIAAYELAYRMQIEAPEAVDLSQETQATQAMYGLNDKKTEAMARSCLMARRLSERGVRFVQIYCGSGSRWDAHSGIEKNHAELCHASDQPVAALLTDLKQRGMLDETLVVWGGEFGRTPMSEQGNGRDHNSTGFTMWLAGGGVRGGQVIGSTDELGLRAVEDPVHVHDLHATFLHALGLEHRQLTYAHNGREENPTINNGQVVTKVFTG